MVCQLIRGMSCIPSLAESTKLTFVCCFPNITDNTIHDPSQLFRIVLLGNFVSVRGIDEDFREWWCSRQMMWCLQLTLDNEGRLQHNDLEHLWISKRFRPYLWFNFNLLQSASEHQQILLPTAV
jgi:hypothetical protein